LARRPDFLLCDEAVSALDVSVRAGALNLLTDRRDALGPACLFIAHDIGVVAYVASRIAGMYRGGIVEQGQAPQAHARLVPHLMVLAGLARDEAAEA
jgi:peptide/nickel transport system ATP-binding protein